MALDPGITRQFRKLYVAFKADSNFVDVIPQKARLRLALNIPIENLRDERGLASDVSDKGHWGNGPTEVGLDEGTDLNYIVGLARQALSFRWVETERTEVPLTFLLGLCRPFRFAVVGRRKEVPAAEPGACHDLMAAVGFDSYQASAPQAS